MLKIVEKCTPWFVDHPQVCKFCGEREILAHIKCKKYKKYVRIYEVKWRQQIKVY